MQTATGTSSAEGSSPVTGAFLADANFAGLLASMAARQNLEAPWNDDQLAQDVATISYEDALRAHMRVRQGNSDAEADIPVASGSQRHSARRASPLKTATITIRLSETECARLRKRATEAGMTVSAYLRSCTLEVESLRAQVKEALAEFRNRQPAIQESKTEPVGGITSVLHHLWNWVRLIGPGRRRAMRLNPANPFAPAR